MDLTNITLLLFGSVLLILTLFILYLIVNTRNTTTNYPKFNIAKNEFQFKKRINSVEIENAKRDLQSYVIEKELAANALTRLYEAEQDDVITKEQRNKLSTKYVTQLNNINERMGDFELLIEVSDMENLKDELINSFENKLKQLNNRLTSSKSKLNKNRTLQDFSINKFLEDDISQIPETKSTGVADKVKKTIVNKNKNNDKNEEKQVSSLSSNDKSSEEVINDKSSEEVINDKSSEEVIDDKSSEETSIDTESEENINLPEDPVDNQIQELKDDVLSALSNLEKIEVDDDEKK